MINIFLYYLTKYLITGNSGLERKDFQVTSGLEFFVIGHPIGHSMSPFIHKRLFELSGLKAVYSAVDIPPEKLGEELPSLLKKARGINVTIPHKQAVIPFLDGLGDCAGLYQSVNTISIDENGCFGYNTDAKGFVLALKGGGIPLKGRVAILGCGGVGRTFACEAAMAGCRIVNAVRESSRQKAENLRSFVLGLYPGTEYEIVEIGKLSGDFDLLINATPVGMYPNCVEMPVKEGVLSRVAAGFDSIYNPEETMLLKAAKACGARVLGGMPMLVMQAAHAHKIWYGAEFGRDDIRQLIEDSNIEMRNHFI